MRNLCSFFSSSFVRKNFDPTRREFSSRVRERMCLPLHGTFVPAPYICSRTSRFSFSLSPSSFCLSPPASHGIHLFSDGIKRHWPTAVALSYRTGSAQTSRIPRPEKGKREGANGKEDSRFSRSVMTSTNPCSETNADRNNRGEMERRGKQQRKRKRRDQIKADAKQGLEGLANSEGQEEQ